MVEVLNVPIVEVTPDPSQPRKTFLKEELDRLAKSIGARGVLVPIRAFRDEARQLWRIVSGESRWRAAKLANCTHVPILPVSSEISETDILADQITENEVRGQLKPLELARAISRLKSLRNIPARDLAQELGISNSSISRGLALLGLPVEIQQMVDDGRIVESAAYEISKLSDEAGQFELANSLASKKLNRDQAAEAVRSKNGKGKAKKPPRLPLKLDGGVCITVTGKQTLSVESLQKAIAQLQAVLANLGEGKDLNAVLKALRAS